ncbi:hypothetical protein O6H91_02G089000 [Diphasiastrum complanatum]|uniref:Uncharacterized protein n=1 Tax=Diphasiastrum complanatum TaxID=34168 RepID=A0ACC2EHS2_DIPCM|nr:hypothetical protein O6H91_02G089000 [Diphasiastrum complanatum]
MLRSKNFRGLVTVTISILVLVVMGARVSNSECLSLVPVKSLDPSKAIQLSHYQIESITTALLQVGSFNLVAGLFSDSQLKAVPQGTTVFAPTDEAILTTDLIGCIEDHLHYHTVIAPLTFQSLLKLPTGTRLPTFLPGFTVLMTNNEPNFFLVDNIHLFYPDLYSDGTVVVHGITGVMNASLYGKASELSTFTSPVSSSQPLQSSFPPIHNKSASDKTPISPSFAPTSSQGNTMYSGTTKYADNVIVGSSIRILSVYMACILWL